MVHTTVIHQCLMIDVANTTRKEKKRVRPHFTVHGKKPTNPRPLACKADVATTAPRCPTKLDSVLAYKFHGPRFDSPSRRKRKVLRTKKPRGSEKDVRENAISQKRLFF
ncbi:uncharacterized protein LOC142236224 isoform X1 [Haematobia irritans]|uniref:uncharacterized protein LOC142236224 isoform X1 n=1 Tax=Haematobia irritans TaxID=7368 RepID=UPI003F505FDC